MEITLKEQRLTKSLMLWADKTRRSPDEMLENAVAAYLADMEAESLRQETDVFWNRLPELRKQFPHQFVAIHQGEVIGHSEELDGLMRRVQKAFGDLPVLIASVDSPPPREIHWSGGRK